LSPRAHHELGRRFREVQTDGVAEHWIFVHSRRWRPFQVIVPEAANVAERAQ
jgi:hypothetical protein